MAHEHITVGNTNINPAHITHVAWAKNPDGSATPVIQVNFIGGQVSVLASDEGAEKVAKTFGLDKQYAAWEETATADQKAAAHAERVAAARAQAVADLAEAKRVADAAELAKAEKAALAHAEAEAAKAEKASEKAEHKAHK